MAVHAETRPTVVVTGGLGRVAQLIRPTLATRYRLRLLDREAYTAEEYVRADLTEPGAAIEALRGATALVHLAGSANPRIGWDQAYRANIVSTQWLLDAAAATGVPRVVLASSVHAIGEYNRPQYRPVPHDVPPWPCCPYGLSKVVIETLGRHHAESTGASVICLRLGLVGWPLVEERHLGMWLSDGDAVQLFEAALTAPVPYGVYTGVSANSRHHWDISRARDELGYHPRDDSESQAVGAGPPTEVLCRLFDETENTIPGGGVR
ncbi:NAD-dependent epimerase/dehydratase family protein [Nonomuraea sp. 3N208]|uniref:NAD-dependent epimerase/dehydratase family protein n=1 Tax=Nonomuraea sp. 3N208 TaxID=3457421 RepID=UPI003FCD7D6A